jgi:D-serine deaminase-like pyridoxal phosphate-dependent protein
MWQTAQLPARSRRIWRRCPSPPGRQDLEPSVQGVRLSAEHAIIELSAGSAAPVIGDRVEFAVGYSDTTVHLHEEIFAIRGSRAEAVWRVSGRGKLK